MREFLGNSMFFGVFLTLLAYCIGLFVQKKLKHMLFNPLLIAIILTIAALLVLDIDYDTYYDGAKYLSYLLTPATVCLAIPLYEQLEKLKQNWRAVLAGIASGISMVFLPSMTNYVVSNYLTFRNVKIIGKLIDDYFTGDLWHDGSFIALLLLLFMFLATWLTGGFSPDEQTDTRGTALW